EGETAERAHPRGDDERQQHHEIERALAREAVADEGEWGGQRRHKRQRHRSERDDEGVGGGFEPGMAREVLRVIAGPIARRRKLERDRLPEGHRDDERHWGGEKNLSEP